MDNHCFQMPSIPASDSDEIPFQNDSVYHNQKGCTHDLHWPASEYHPFPHLHGWRQDFHYSGWRNQFQCVLTPAHDNYSNPQDPLYFDSTRFQSDSSPQSDRIYSPAYPRTQALPLHIHSHWLLLMQFHGWKTDYCTSHESALSHQMSSAQPCHWYFPVSDSPMPPAWILADYSMLEYAAPMNLSPHEHWHESPVHCLLKIDTDTDLILHL